MNTQGISSCFSNVIILESGYWRRHNTSTAILACPLGKLACNGTALVNYEICNDGYVGNLCANCAKKYVRQQGKCLPCSDSNKLSIKPKQ